MEPATFGRYRLLELIGEGGMGRVFRAHDPMMRREVAIKLLRPDYASDPEYRERFRREALKAAGLTEPHIIPIHDFGDHEGQLFIVMPFIEGSTLDDVLRRDGPMPVPRAVNIIEQLAGALTASHAKKLTHRDVKPSNALVTVSDFVYLIDFGIAHDAAATKLTRTGGVVGSMAYMAPERFVHGTADPRADVYSLTCVLHECLTGTMPFPGSSIEQQIAAHLTAAPPKASSQRPGLPTALDDVVARGMAKDPDERFQTTRDLAIAARGALGAPHEIRPRPDPSPAAATTPAAFAALSNREVVNRPRSTSPADPEPGEPPSTWTRTRLSSGFGALLIAAGSLGVVPNVVAPATDNDMPVALWWLAVLSWVLFATALLLLGRWAARNGKAALRVVARTGAAVAIVLTLLEVLLDFLPTIDPSISESTYRYVQMGFSGATAIFGVVLFALGTTVIRTAHRGFAIALFASLPLALGGAYAMLFGESWFWAPYSGLLLSLAAAGGFAMRRVTPI